MSASNAPSNQPCGRARPVHSPTKLSEPSVVAYGRGGPHIQYTHAPSSVTASIMAKKKTKASSLRSTVVLPYALVPKVEIDNGSDSSQRDNRGEHEPSLWSPNRIRIERAYRLQQVIRYGPAKPDIGLFPEVIPEHHVNLLGCNLLRHRLTHQEGGDLLSVVVRKLKTQDRWLRARW